MDTDIVVEMTTEELFALPDNEDVDRELIGGRLWEEPVSTRTPRHSQIEARVAHLLGTWLNQSPQPRGRVFSGECAFRIRRRPDTTVGIDLAYVSAELAARTSDDATWIDGPPLLAVEILSPSDTFSKAARKVREYLAAGVALIWIIDPFLNVVYVHRPQVKMEILIAGEELSGEPHLDGLRIPIADVFGA